MYEAAPTYADLKCNGLTLLAVHFWLTVRVACGMLDQRKDLAAKGYQGLQSWPRQEEVTCPNTSILRTWVGFSQFHPLRSMRKSHTAEAKEAERCCHQALKQWPRKTEFSPYRNSEASQLFPGTQGPRLIKRLVLKLPQKGLGAPDHT